MQAAKNKAIARCKEMLNAFNAANSHLCASYYDALAILSTPEQQFVVGQDDIDSFWRDFIQNVGCKASLVSACILSENHDYFAIKSVWHLEDGSQLHSNETWYEHTDKFEIIEQGLTRLRPTAPL